MSTRAALLAAVLAAPDDDTPRLVFADWLDEHGDSARAAFIRLEVEAERYVPHTFERTAFEERAAALYNRHVDRWNAELPSWATWNESLVVYRRGFPAELHTTLRRLLRDGAGLFSLCPIERVRIRHRAAAGTWTSDIQVGQQFGRGTVWPDMSAVRTVQFGPGERGLFDTVRRGSTEWDSDTLQGLCVYPSLAGLRQLVLAGNILPDEFLPPLLRRLSDAVFVASLSVLDLSDNQITDAGAAFLHAAPWVDQLAELDLSGNRIGDAGRALLRQRFGDRVTL